VDAPRDVAAEWLRGYGHDMSVESLLRALAGGSLIGLAAAMVLVLHGRIAGISGIIHRALDHDARTFRIPFLAALVVAGAVAARLAPAAIPEPERGIGLYAIAGLLVGIGTTLGNGCTSGHGICGIGRFSKRSAVAVIVFMGVGAITVAIAGSS
jgi:uncharacterized membrane protein YedE/YeeE